MISAGFLSSWSGRVREGLANASWRRLARREQSEKKRGVQWKDLVTKAQVKRGLVGSLGYGGVLGAGTRA